MKKQISAAEHKSMLQHLRCKRDIQYDSPWPAKMEKVMSCSAVLTVYCETHTYTLFGVSFLAFFFEAQFTAGIISTFDGNVWRIIMHILKMG